MERDGGMESVKSDFSVHPHEERIVNDFSDRPRLHFFGVSIEIEGYEN